MGWYHDIVLISLKGVGFQGAFSEFPAVGGIAATPAFLCHGRLLSATSNTSL